MALARLKPLAIQRLNKPGKYADGGGLYLVVTKAGNKKWSFRFMLNGKAREMGLGALSDVTVEDAREAAAEARKLAKQGIDPIDNRKAEKQTQALEKARQLTFDECAARYIEAHSPSWRNPKHHQQWRNTLKTYASPVIGSLPVQDIDTNLVIQILEPIWTTKTETASRVRMRIESVLDWAKVREYRDGENPARWKGHLANILPPRKKVQRVKHHPALPYAEIPAFMEALRKLEGVAPLALEFTILTACRTGEVRGATWEEFNLKAGLWTIPGERMKGDREHVVTLSPRAVAILKQLEPLSQRFVFPGLRANRGLSNGAMTAVLKRMDRKDLTVHGFRSTFRDWAAERTNAPSWVAEKALAHVVADKVEAAYRRGELIDKRRGLMEQWAQYCASKPGDVVKIGKAASQN